MKAIFYEGYLDERTIWEKLKTFPNRPTKIVITEHNLNYLIEMRLDPTSPIMKDYAWVCHLPFVLIQASNPLWGLEF